ncbi:phytanoyl-CoA dioxygenase family protein [Candidatus Poribacteria bacterium]|nr:phytanoyl-CoA dioxygenase family protein [Candidatus Poribacteria bacterium]
MSLRDDYQRDGYVIHPEPVIPADVVRAASEGMDALRRGEYDTGTPPQPSYWNPGDDPDKLCKIEMPQIANRAIWELVSHPALGRLAAEVTGAQRVQVWWVQLLGKPPSPPGADIQTNIGWHQDRYYWRSWEEGSELFTAWVAVSDATADAGPMRFVRGSHKWGFVEGSDFFGQDHDAQRKVIAPDGAEWEEESAILSPGGVSFHDCLTMHASGQNRSGVMRRSFAIHMRTERSAPVDGKRAGLTSFIDDESRCPVIHRAGA